MDKEILTVSQSSVAKALAADYFCIYYVNTENSKFIEYSASPEYKALGLPASGDDIIGFALNPFKKIVYEKDQKLFEETFTRENVLRELEKTGHFTLTFRMVFDGVPTYVHLKATRMTEKDANHIVIGISSVDEQMKAKEAFEKEHNANLTYSRVSQALAGDYFVIYIVDADTDKFIEYSATEGYDDLGVEKQGEDFFGASRRNMSRIMDPRDLDRFMAIFRKEKILPILEESGSFTMKYRLIFGGVPTYISLKATLLDDEFGRHIIIGTNNINAQMKQEEEYQEKIAEAKNRARNDFLANMSHDIRTPMNAIVGYTNIANSNLHNPDIIKDSLEKIGSSSHFLLSLINDILDFSKIESGKMQLSIADCDLNQMFKRIHDITSLQAKNKHLNITYDHSGVKHYFVKCDELRIEQILINIISNAIKYTPEGRNVDLRAKELEAETPGKAKYRFTIKDTGVGISEEYLPYIFDSFTREQNTTINRIQGTGLGLAITARVVELMEGNISVKSKLGEGSEFTVDLTLDTIQEKAEDKAKEERIVDLKGKKILLVEDNDINAEIASMILSQYNAETERACNGQECVELIKANAHYDAVLMDIQMPVMNGYEATQTIRELNGEYFKNIPIIAMSANAYDEDVEACHEAGMNAHIAKPFDPLRLVEILDDLICS